MTHVSYLSPQGSRIRVKLRRVWRLGPCTRASSGDRGWSGGHGCLLGELGDGCLVGEGSLA